MPLVVRSIRVLERDFGCVIGDIMASGATKAELARALNVPWSTVKSWTEGCRPPHHYGEALLTIRAAVAKSRDTSTSIAA